MKRSLLISLTLLLLLPGIVRASHIFAGDLLYTHISGNTYKITLTLYGDCGAASNLISDLYIGSPDIFIRDGGISYSVLRLDVDSASGEDVSPVCPAQKDSTTCTFGVLPGIRRYIYSNTITLPYHSPNWQFVYEGRITDNSQAGRSNNITNVFDVGNQLMYLVATLNSSLGDNSSPVYTTIPTPYYCVNVTQQFNHGATDPDLDSLGFEMVPALKSGAAVIYNSPYTGQFPMSAPDFTFNPLNGQMTFTPDMLQNALVVNKISEFKNGVEIGSSMREMTFIVIPCQNIPPNGDLSTNGSNITGGIHQGNNVINVCKKNASVVSFTIQPDDANAHDVKISTYNVPAGANLTVLNDSTTNPTINFSWNVVSVPPGIYTFYINYTDDGCPLTSSKTIAYTIRIADPYSLAAEVIEETQCQHKALVQLTVSNGILPRTVVLSQGANVIKTYTDTTGIITDSLAAGSYTVSVSNPLFPCDTSINFTITDGGQYPDTPVLADTIYYCQFDIPAAFAPGNVTGSLNWYDANGNALSATPVVNTDVPGSYTWYLSQVVNVCESARKKVHVIVNPRPDVGLLIKDGTVCLADKIYLLATGAETYTWKPELKIEKEADGRLYIRITEPITITAIGTDTLGCRDTAAISLTQIENCCRFAYPNAFTPNGDGKNDRFRPILYGNMEEYDLFIYNRFGEVVFRTSDPLLGWDGLYKGQLCDVGMYYFRVKAKCYTGQTEEHADAVDLLR